MMKKIETLIATLKAMGFNPVHNEAKKNVNFSSHGSDNFKERDKRIVREILGGNLLEFFYGHDTQYIYYQ